MKIYFGASVSGKKRYLLEYQTIVEALRQLGHEVVYGDFFDTSVEKVLHQTHEEKIHVHEQLGKMKLESDIVVIETSFRSFALGQEIAHAFRIGKPVLALYTNGQMPHFILSDSGDRLIVMEYALETVKEVMKEGIAYLNPKETKRFTMNLEASYVDYLDRISREKHVSRSDYLRNLLMQDMQKLRSPKV